MRRTLAVRLDSDGDVLLTGPAVRAIAAASDHITFLCSERGRNAASLLPEVDDVIVFNAPWILFDPPAVDNDVIAALVSDVRARDIDTAVIFSSFHQSPLPAALLLRMAGVSRIAAISVDYPGSLLDVRHSVEDDIHEVERNLSLSTAAGFPLPAGETSAMKVRLDERCQLPFAGPYVAVHPGAAVAARAWAPTNHRALVNELVCSGRRVVVTGSPAERPLCEEVTGDHDSDVVVNLAGATTLGELAWVLRHAEATIVANTGPAHLAAAVGTPIVSLFAATVPDVRWKPWGVPLEIVGDHSVSCRNCRARVCPVEGHPCIDNVTPADVVAALDRLLAGTKAA